MAMLRALWLPILVGCGFPGAMRTPGWETDPEVDTDLPVDSDVPPDGSHCGEIIEGVDVSGWDPGIVWSEVADVPICFAYVKATEGVTFQSSEYENQYDGSAEEGLIRGAYHFALPHVSDGVTQAEFFVENGGDWVEDGQTLPGALDIEYNPYGETCYDLTTTEMQEWIWDFSDTYLDLTGRRPSIYTTANWWNSCVDSDEFGEHPLWVAHYGAETPNLPDGWDEYTIWQYTSSGAVAGMEGDVDRNVFAGDFADLYRLARGE